MFCSACGKKMKLFRLLEIFLKLGYIFSAIFGVFSVFFISEIQTGANVRSIQNVHTYIDRLAPGYFCSRLWTGGGRPQINVRALKDVRTSI